MSLQEWRAKELISIILMRRLEKTYADFIGNEKGFAGLPAFFRDHIYSPQDKEKRDIALENLYSKIKSITGPEMAQRIHKLIQLNHLTDALDLELAQTLLKGPWRAKITELHADNINEADIEWGMRQANQVERRLQQIDMVCDSLSFFFSLSKLPLVRLVIAPIKVAASMVGASELVTAMEEGYQLARKIKKIDEFVEAFKKREQAYLKGLMVVAT